MLAGALPLPCNRTAEELALLLLEREINHIVHLAPSDRVEFLRKIAKLGAPMGEAARGELGGLVKRTLGIGKIAFRKLLDEQAKKKEAESDTDRQARIDSIRPSVIDFYYHGSAYYRRSGTEADSIRWTCRGQRAREV